MKKTSYILFALLGFATGIFLPAILRPFGINLDLGKFWYAIFGEPTLVSVTIVAFISILFIYSMIKVINKIADKTT